MTPFEFRVLRISLGLTAQDIATVHEVALRTAQRWESTHQPPADAQAWILDRWAHFADIVGDFVERADSGERIELVACRDDDAAFERYGMSADESTALLGHVAMALTQCDFDFVIVPEG